MKYPKLLDCPFCGGIATIVRDESTSFKFWKIVCTSCGGAVGGNMFPYTSPEEVADAWNTRGGICINPDGVRPIRRYG